MSECGEVAGNDLAYAIFGMTHAETCSRYAQHVEDGEAIRKGWERTGRMPEEETT